MFAKTLDLQILKITEFEEKKYHYVNKNCNNSVNFQKVILQALGSSNEPIIRLKQITFLCIH